MRQKCKLSLALFGEILSSIHTVFFNVLAVEADVTCADFRADSMAMELLPMMKLTTLAGRGLSPSVLSFK
jgi:hypothetical protein